MKGIKQFKSDVEHEIKMLKQHATAAELKRLDFTWFNHMHMKACIYGQMTGSCESKRAKKLMNVSCIRVMELLSGGTDIIDNVLMSSTKFKVNGAYTGQTWEALYRRYSYLSALEGYICTRDAKTEHIIDFLKDTTNTIKLKL